MSDDMKAAVIIDEPNFLLQAMQLMDSFYNREPGENTAGWINRPLVNKDKFTLPEKDINETFSDIADYIRLIRGEAAACLEGSDGLGEMFSLATLDEKGEAKDYFLSVALLSANDADSVSGLSRDDFVKGCLRRLEYLSELPDNPADEELQGNHDVSPAFSMGDVFAKLNDTLFNDAQRMALLRFFQDIDRYYERVREGLEKLEEVCRRHYPLVEARCREKMERYLRQGSESLPVKFLYRLVLKGETLRPRDPVHICVTPVLYNSMGFRFFVDQPLNKLVYVGMIYEDLDELKNKQKRRQERTESQLKAIADPTRLLIVRMLSRRPHYVQELADALGLSPATLSHHLKVLLEAMLAGIGVEGRRSYYSLNAQELSGLAMDLQAMADTALEENP